ncbi:MAG: S-methyl-5-thioribose-1-phosphate isomerase [Gammaproteobacteria bacterium]
MGLYDSKVHPIIWSGDHLQLIDQRKLPHAITIKHCYCCAEAEDAIRDMVVRGAPAIGVTAAYAVVLAAREAVAERGEGWRTRFDEKIRELKRARPTAVNLAWAIEQMMLTPDLTAGNAEQALLEAAKQLHAADIKINQTMGDLGASLIDDDAHVITHCNAGALATAGYGTALGVIRSAHRQRRIANVFACETRPWLQGARLTAWELMEDKIPVTLLADHAAAQLMLHRQGTVERISWVITGADRVAANGDVANKIGTYSLAVAARAHGVGMMVVAPCSTIDLQTSSGTEIPIETRDCEELLTLNGTRIAPNNVSAINPVFDVTPAELIDVLVTERGVIHNPGRTQIKALFD